MLVLTAEQMKQVEVNATKLGMSWLRLMENAGAAAAKTIRNKFDLKSKNIVIVCGKGNNGGDGYVIARKLFENGINVRVISVMTPSTESAKEMYSKACNIGIKPIDYESYTGLCDQYILDADLIIDAIFGTGFQGAPKDAFCKIITTINNSNATVISIDVPSGISSDKGTIDGEFVVANTTVAFDSYKPCHLLYPSNEYCGDINVVSIGIPEKSYNGVVAYAKVVTNDDLKPILPIRSKNHHKGLCGTAGLYVGCKSYPGAAVIALKSAILSGVGIANAIIPDSIYPIVAGSVTEAVYTVLKGDIYGNKNPDDVNIAIKSISSSTATLIGCGIGNTEYSKHNVTEILKSCTVPLVIDADGINVLSNSIDIIRDYKAQKILTPHPKEAARLLKTDLDYVLSNRAEAAKSLAESTNSTVILKGANTIIATYDGKLYFITDGNPGMSTAGTGDMLAGMAVALLAQGLLASDSAILAAKLHALSGDRALKTTSLLSLTPTAMMAELPKVINDLYTI